MAEKYVRKQDMSKISEAVVGCDVRMTALSFEFVIMTDRLTDGVQHEAPCTVMFVD